jgi:hypothetical protein
VTPAIFQQGTYAPGASDGIHRWMGGIGLGIDNSLNPIPAKQTDRVRWARVFFGRGPHRDRGSLFRNAGALGERLDMD